MPSRSKLASIWLMMRLRLAPMSLGPAPTSKKVLLAITTPSRRWLRNQLPRIRSDSPSLYLSEVSKKLPPASTKRSAMAWAAGSSAPHPNVCVPKQISETFVPLRPKKR